MPIIADGPRAKKGNQKETPHVEVQGMFKKKDTEIKKNIGKKKVSKESQIREAKRKYPLGEKLYVPG